MVRVVRRLVAPWLVAVLATAGALGVHHWEGVLLASQRRLPPLVEVAPWGFAALAIVAVGWAAARGVKGLVRFRGRRRIAATVGLIAAHVIIALGVVGGAIATDPDLLGPDYDSSLRSPHGSTIYLYHGGLFCEVELYERAPGALLLHHLRTITPDACSDDLHLAWSESRDAPIVVDAAGHEVVDGTSFRRAFDWGPH